MWPTVEYYNQLKRLKREEEELLCSISRSNRLLMYTAPTLKDNKIIILKVETSVISIARLIKLMKLLKVRGITGLTPPIRKNNQSTKLLKT